MSEAATQLIVRALTEALTHLEAVAGLVASRGDDDDRKVYEAGVAQVKDEIRATLRGVSARSPGLVPAHLLD